jgi:hypothetical protein
MERIAEDVRMAQPKFPRLSRARRAKMGAATPPLVAPIDANPTIVNSAGYQETPPSPDAVAKDQTLRENCALLERARADDPDRCKDAAVPALLRETRPRSRR